MPTLHDDKRCWHTTIDGRRCRMERMETHPELCFYHWQREEELADALKNSAQIVSPRAKLSTARGINRVLGNILKAHAQGKIPARSAATMAYTCQLLLLSLPYLIKERAAEKEKEKRLQDVRSIPLSRGVGRVLDAVIETEGAATTTPEEEAVARLIARAFNEQENTVRPETIVAMERINDELQGRNRHKQPPRSSNQRAAP